MSAVPCEHEWTSNREADLENDGRITQLKSNAVMVACVGLPTPHQGQCADLLETNTPMAERKGDPELGFRIWLSLEFLLGLCYLSKQVQTNLYAIK